MTSRNRLEHEENDGNIETENYFLFLSGTNYPIFKFYFKK